MAKWPLSFDASTRPTIEALETRSGTLSSHTQSYGSMFDTHKDDVFMMSADFARRYQIEQDSLVPVAVGDEIRNWQLQSTNFVLRPYDTKWKLRKEDKASRLFGYLRLFRHELGGRATFGKGTYDQAGEPWYRYHQMSVEKILAPICIVYPEIATHGHFLPKATGVMFTQTAPLMLLRNSAREPDNLLTASAANSAAALLWLKQQCFNKGAGEDEHLDRFEYAGEKVHKLPVPLLICDALQGKTNPMAERLTELSKACWECGQQMPSLSLKKLFEKPGEAYHEWNSSLPGYVPPNPELGAPFQSETGLRDAYQRAQAIRERLRAVMIALQEEMDWLVYAAYGLLPTDDPAVGLVGEGSALPREPGGLPYPIDQAQRPFRLWQQVGGNYAKAVALIPASWPAERQGMWKARLAAIRDNEHIRRIEQPVYKRRWDEQWKVGNEWRSGSVAYAAEFVDAFEWWLSEKAEWWLEHKKNGGPVEMDDWAATIWKDSRVQAAWPVAAENYALLEYEKAAAKAEANGEPVPTPPAERSATQQSLVGAGQVPALGQGTHEGCPYAFLKTFKRIIEDETVPEDIPFAVPYDELEKREIKISPKVKSIRGKLNVPRERFHLRGRSTYLWAGLQFH